MDHQTQRFPFEQFRQARFGGRPNCPHCRADRVHRWGSFSGRRRYRCVACRRTFSDFTATPLASLKRIDRWPGFCQCTLATLTVRQTGARLGIDKNTAFRWRHRLLGALRADDNEPLTGTVAVHETWLAHSAKGNRRLNRPARVRKALKRAEITPVWVIFAQDQTDRLASAVAGRLRPGASVLEHTLGPRLPDPRELVSSVGPYGAVGTLAVRMGVSYRRARTGDPIIGRLRRYAVALRRWLRRFRGVATRYPAHYLAWYQFEVMTSGRSPGVARRFLLIGRFP